MSLPRIPAAFFGIVLGVAGLGNSWRAAASVWTVSPHIAEVISLLGFAIWFALIILYAAKWLVAPKEAMAELQHPIQCCFVGLIGVATMLAGLSILPYSHIPAELIVLTGFAFTLLFLLWRTGLLWRGGRDPATNTPVLYLPTVAGSFVTAIAAGTLGYADWGQLAFGAGFFSWLAIESVLLHRLLMAPELAQPLRPTLGIQIAPPAVGSVAYLSVNGGAPDMLVHAMFGYAILQVLIVGRQLSWIMQQPFAGSYWAFTFGLTALSTAAVRMAAHGDTGAIGHLAPVIFVLVNIALALIAIGTLWLLIRGKLFPAPVRA
ncbi:tellurite resistance protein [Rhizobium sp. BK650]|uniref:dicarboxylate transporter/tellurite-resistance protein TehA n=1 Tax=Rhizobium sp. BK650 TaxID=2586990 RepID=UPI0016150C94|nr:dicarboxylate transporter/tellurite-resistance protein TehA [Rhizobium sp. BK650]MBB3660925.1 tellurite resistance protein [Rhizobium sp. BK650]